MSEGFYHVCRAHECEFRSLGLSLVAGRAPEPLLGVRGRSGLSLSFLCGPRASFSFRRRGVCRVCRAPECEFGSLGLGLVAGRAPEPLHGARGRSGVPLAFCVTLAHPFRSEGGVVCRALECAPRSLGLDMVAGRAPEPLHGARGRSGVPLAFCATLARPFHSDGGVVCRALACEPESLGLGKFAGIAP